MNYKADQEYARKVSTVWRHLRVFVGNKKKVEARRCIQTNIQQSFHHARKCVGTVTKLLVSVQVQYSGLVSCELLKTNQWILVPLPTVLL